MGECCGGCCRWCIGFQFTLGLTALFMWLSLRPSKPHLSVSQFYVPALNRTAIPNLTATIPPHNTTIFFELKLQNPNNDKGIYYDPFNLTLYYSSNQTPVSNLTLPPFYQGFKKTARKTGNFSLRVRAFWQNVTNAISATNMTVLRVGLVTSVRYKIVGVKTKRHRIRVVADVGVNEKGQKAKRKGVKFHSGAHVSNRALPPLVVLLVGMVLLGA